MCALSAGGGADAATQMAPRQPSTSSAGSHLTLFCPPPSRHTHQTVATESLSRPPRLAPAKPYSSPRAFVNGCFALLRIQQPFFRTHTPEQQRAGRNRRPLTPRQRSAKARPLADLRTHCSRFANHSLTTYYYNAICISLSSRSIHFF